MQQLPDVLSLWPHSQTCHLRAKRDLTAVHRHSIHRTHIVAWKDDAIATATNLITHGPMSGHIHDQSLTMIFTVFPTSIVDRPIISSPEFKLRLFRASVFISPLFRK